MIQLRPTEQFTIVRVLGDTVDTSTYYVQAVIRNSNTDAIIDTVNLTDQGNRRFTGGWEVVADVGGEGFYVDVTTTVYTDSGFTTNAPDYAEESETYLIQDRYNRTFGLGGGGGVDVDYSKLRRIVKEEIKGIIMPKQEKIDLKPIQSSIKDVLSEVGNIKFPEQKETDLSEVISNIKITKDAIDNKHIPEPEKINLIPIIKENSKENNNIILDIGKMLKIILKEVKSSNDETNKIFNKFKSQKIKFDLTHKLKKFFITPEDLEVEGEEEPIKKPEIKPKKVRKFLTR